MTNHPKEESEKDRGSVVKMQRSGGEAQKTENGIEPGSFRFRYVV